VRTLCLTALLGLLLSTCTDPDDGDRFACGDHGGTCDRASELCILGGADRCSTCVPLPDACDADATCGCIPPGDDPGNDALWGAYTCDDAGSCAAVDGGRVLTCADVSWGCG
jgi:hypothetical protein